MCICSIDWLHYATYAADVLTVINAFMNKFRKLGLIDYNGHIEVHRSLLNVVLHENPQIRA